MYGLHESTRMRDVSVLVVSYQSEEYLPECLASVARQKDIATETIVVDNASTDGTTELVTNRFPGVRLVKNRQNRGFATAINQGLALTKGEYVLLLNPDARLCPGALGLLVDFLEANPGAAASGPRQWLAEDRNWQWSVVPRPPHWRLILAGRKSLKRFGFARRRLARYWALNQAIWRGEQPQAAPYLSGACMLLRRGPLEAVGGLDEAFFLFFEDVDLCERLRAAGWSLFVVPAAGVVHRAMGSVGAVGDSGQAHLLSSGSLYLARHGDPLTRMLWSVLLKRRSMHHARQLGPAEAPEITPRSISWQPIPGAAAYWIEVSLEPTFLYVAASEVSQPACQLPEGLLAIVPEGRMFWRVAQVDPEGRLGSLLPTRLKKRLNQWID